MVTLTPGQYDLFGGALAFFFTVALLSYLIGDNPIYRIALHLFIGVAIGYGVLVVVFQVLVPRLLLPMLSGDVVAIGLALVPLLLFIFLILKLSPRTSGLGNLAIAYLIGVGAAVAVGGAVSGTVLPQIRSTWTAWTYAGPLATLVIVVGTITTLIYFQFWLRGRSASGDPQRIPLIRLAANVGQGFLVLTLAAIYGGMILSGIAIFSHQITLLAGWFRSLGGMP
jgi:hypothetical protein